jgi:uncharacterized protein (UPF0548 family)
MTLVEPFNFPGTPTILGAAPVGYRTTIRSRVLFSAAGATNAPSTVAGAVGPAVDQGTIHEAAVAVFRRAGVGVLLWKVHSGAGFRPIDVPERVALGAVSRWEIPFGPLHPTVRCRVFDVITADDRIGFGHGALVGHPQHGWESYVVTLDDQDTVTLTVRVVWRPAAWWLKVAGPLAAVALDLLLRRNLRALDGWLANSEL